MHPTSGELPPLLLPPGRPSPRAPFSRPVVIRPEGGWAGMCVNVSRLLRGDVQWSLLDRVERCGGWW
jgi:hypothetical protein